MKLIIDVPENIYEALRKAEAIISSQRSGKSLTSIIFDAVANGIPLPKGHGRLIDADDLKWQFDKRDELNGFTENIIAGTPTIIEADKERSEE